MASIPLETPEGKLIDEKRQAILMQFIALNEGKPLRCGRRIDGARTKGATDWKDFPSEIGIEKVHLRTIVPSQIVFDIGDCNDYHCAHDEHRKCWTEKAVPYTHAIQQALDFLGIPYLTSLSGGKGIHIEVFSDRTTPVGTERICSNCGHADDHAGDEKWHCDVEMAHGDCGCQPMVTPPDGSWGLVRIYPASVVRHEWRTRFASRVLTLASIFSGRTVEADPRLKSPNASSRLVRDWGQRKSDWTSHSKRVWPAGVPLPATREQAYEMVSHGVGAIPEALPIDEGLADRYSLVAKGCPKSPACFDPRSNDGWPGCGDCSQWNAQGGWDAASEGTAKAASTMCAPSPEPSNAGLLYGLLASTGEG